MELDKIKQQTTWNDASGSININFEKIRQAIVSLLGGGGGAKIEIDSEMSDTSENAVQNKVVKQYVDQLRADLDAIVNGDASAAIESINEILAFLSTIEDTTTLEGIIAGLKASMEKYTDDEVAHIEGVLNARIDSLEGGNVYNVYYTENNELSEEQLEANKKAYAALVSEEKAAFYLVQEGNVYSRLIVSTTMKSASIEAIAVEAHVILTTGNQTILGTTAINLYSDGHISMTVVQSNLPTEDEVNAALEQKQDVLVSGTTIKTINGQDILGEGDLIIQGGSGGAEVRTLFVNDAGLSADELSYNAETVQLIFAQHPMIFFASAEEGTPLSEYELMGMDNGRMVFARYELNEFSTGATYIYLAMDGSTEVEGFSKSELDGDKYDKYLDADSVNAVQNKVVTENIRALEATMPLMAVIDLDAIIAQDTPIDNATRNALLELGGYTSGDKYFSKGWIWSRGYLYTIKVIPTDAGVQIHVLSLKGWTEIAEDNSKVNHLPSQGGGNVEVDSELSDTSENAVSNKAVTMALAETEEVAAAALNELNKRFEEYATKEDLEDALADVSIEVDSAMSDTSENAVSNKVIKKYVDDADKSVKEYVDDADNALSERINALEQNSGGGGSSNAEVDSELSESSTNAIANKAVTEAIIEDEEVVAAALNELNERVSNAATREELAETLAAEIQNAKDVIDTSIIDNEEVTAVALVDLDKRLKDIVKILENAGLM